MIKLYKEASFKNNDDQNKMMILEEIWSLME